MNPRIPTEPEAPNSQPKVAGKSSGIIAQKAAMAFAALGLTTAAVTSIETANGATILVGTLSASQLNAGDATLSSEHREATISKIIHLSYEQLVSGGNFTVNLNAQINGIGTGAPTGGTADIGYKIIRDVTGSPTITLWDTNSIPGVTKVSGQGIDANLFDRTATVGNGSELHDTWSVAPNPSANPLGQDFTLGYTHMTDTNYANAQGNFGNASPGTYTKDINVYFTPIPETGAGILAGLGGTLALLRRNREEKRGKESKSTNTSAV